MSAFELVSSLGSFQSRSTHSVRVQSPHKFYTEYAYIEKYGLHKKIGEPLPNATKYLPTQQETPELQVIVNNSYVPIYKY